MTSARDNWKIGPISPLDPMYIQLAFLPLYPGYRRKSDEWWCEPLDDDEEIAHTPGCSAYSMQYILVVYSYLRFDSPTRTSWRQTVKCFILFMNHHFIDIANAKSILFYSLSTISCIGSDRIGSDRIVFKLANVGRLNASNIRTRTHKQWSRHQRPQASARRELQQQ
jgi:hypothetical protein